MKLEHTPEPWVIGTPPPNGEQTIGTENGLMIAVATAGNINTKANARIIAAAPEMLNLLIKLVKCSTRDGWISKLAIETIEKATDKTIDEILADET